MRRWYRASRGNDVRISAVPEHKPHRLEHGFPCPIARGHVQRRAALTVGGVRIGTAFEQHTHTLLRTHPCRREQGGHIPFAQRPRSPFARGGVQIRTCPRVQALAHGPGIAAHGSFQQRAPPCTGGIIGGITHRCLSLVGAFQSNVESRQATLLHGQLGAHRPAAVVDPFA